MAVFDDILGNESGGTPPPKGTQEWMEQQQEQTSVVPAPKGSQEWAEQNSGENAPVPTPTIAATPAPKAEKPVPQPAPEQPTDEGGSFSYADLYKKLNPYKPPTEEELEKERKKEKRNQIFAAIGDGIAALSNLYFTTQYAPNMYTGKNTMSERTQIRYDKLKKEREDNNTAYFNGLMKAMQADESKAKADREWQRQLGLDAQERQRYADNIAHRNEREKVADDRYNAEQEYKKGRDAVGDQQWQQNFDEGKRRANQSHALAVQTQKDNKELRRQQIAATGARAVRGKQLGFSDGDGNQVSIYENVWKGSMQQVYDVLVEDMRAAYEADKGKNPRVPRHKTASEKEDFVKQNWHKSPRASSIMLSLSKLDPATMSSSIDNDIEEYTPSGDDEVIDYVPGK